MTAPRDREHDEWIPWYVEDTAGWIDLSLAARGAMEGIARKLNRKTGKLHLRRGIASLAPILHASWAELEPALAELIAKGKVTWDGSLFVLADPEYVERKRRGTAERVADHRANKRRSDPPPLDDVTDVTPVTLPPLHPLPTPPVTDVTPVLLSSSLISSALDLDPGSGSPSGTDPPASDVRVARVVGPDGDSGQLFGAWRDGIRSATGVPQSELSPSDRRELVTIANTHAGGATGQALLDWVRDTAVAFAKVHDPTFGGFVPLQARKWLDGGRRTRASPGIRHVQSAENRAWVVPKDMP